MIGKLPGFYYKIPVIESALKDYETVVWLDMDGSTPSPVGAPRGPRDCVPFTTCFEENIQFVFPLFRPRSDPRQVHPGSAFMIFRNGSYTRRILHGAWASAEAGRFHKSGDQLAILDQVFTILGEENTEFVYTEGQCVAMDGTDNCFLKVLEDQDHGAIERSTWLQMPDWCETMPQGGNFFLVCECYEPNPKDPSRCSGFETLFDHFGSGSARGCPRCMRNPFLRRLHELDSLLPA
mmetsp:Transcript_41787/g.65270  ORF Transcript_41787/g.65270 Transcript_41787/m.65270 type:complete len:236 (-) Transcript_41787:320-1027(-)